MQRGAHRQRRILQHQLLGALDGVPVDGQHLVHHAEQRIDRGLDAAAALERGVAVQDLGQHFGVGDEPYALRDERLEAPLSIHLVRVRGADEVHRDIGVDEYHGGRRGRSQ